MMTVRSSLSCVSAIALVLVLAAGAASAQSGPAPSTPDRSGTAGAQGLATGGGGSFGTMRPGFMMGPGMMRGPGMWAGRFDGPCDPRAAGIAEWRIDEIERVVRPTDTQRAALADLRAASTKAATALTSACPRETPQTSAQRMAFMERRMEAMLEAVKAVRPAFEAFYATLSDEQKARLDAVGPRRWGWHWRWNG
jgi:LTXXQ motif family protein